jgi:16S rRNA (uracil1498-N3)-methyltransferase
MLPRFLADAIDAERRRATLPADEAHDLTHVLRLEAGDEVVAFDGAGREFRARVGRAGRHGAELALIEELQPLPEPAMRITLAQAVLKGDAMDAVVRDATMMGAAAIVPLITERTIGRGKRVEQRSIERWRRVAVASAKQCRRAVVPAIRPAQRFSEWLAHAELRLMLVEPGANIPTFGAWSPSLPAISLAIGPEGGWTPDELAAAVEAGTSGMTLGRRTLRADAAALVGMSVLLYVSGDL